MMGAMAAAFDRKGEKAPSIVLKMLEELKHRATAEPRVATQPATYIAQFVKGSDDQALCSVVAVGSNNSEPVLGRDFTWIFEGRFFSPNASVMDEIKHEMGQQPLKVSKCILKDMDGSYTFGLAFREKIVVARDALGTKPLYYGENESVYAVATERKALWKIGISNAYSLPPGNLVTIGESGFHFEPVAKIESAVSMKIGMEEAAGQLQRLLLLSTKKRVADARAVAVAFSGGLDSAVIASLAKSAGADVKLVWVGLEGQDEIDLARNAAEILELPFFVRTYTIADVERTLSKVLWLVEEADVMKAGVAIPFFWVAETASNLKYDVLLAGQGADELFGGYQRYLTDYEIGGVKKLEESLHRDVVTSYETNFQRDEPVCAFHKVDLRLPFVDSEVVRFSLSLPASLKIESARDELRKRILRQVARSLGIPSSIADRPKKAVQFSSGVDKALKLLANKKGFAQRSYIESVFKQIYPNSGVHRS
jgi:asparagine synthase (glutamine-hydrolysing)